MDLTERQEKILQDIIEYYLDTAEPVSSSFLKERSGFDCSPATIRNDLQDLMHQGYIAKPHISAGRVPTEKAYKYFVEHLVVEEGNLPKFIIKEIEKAQKKIGKELEAAQELEKSLREISTTLSYTKIQDKNSIVEMLEIIGPSRTGYQKHISLIQDLIKEVEDLL